MQPAAGCIHYVPYSLRASDHWAEPGFCTSMPLETLFCTRGLHVFRCLFAVPVVVKQSYGFRRGLRPSRPRSLCMAGPGRDAGRLHSDLAATRRCYRAMSHTLSCPSDTSSCSCFLHCFFHCVFAGFWTLVMGLCDMCDCPTVFSFAYKKCHYVNLDHHGHSDIQNHYHHRHHGHAVNFISSWEL